MIAAELGDVPYVRHAGAFLAKADEHARALALESVTVHDACVALRVRLGEPRAAAEKAESSDFFALWAEFGAQFAANAPRDAGAVRGASRRPSGTPAAIAAAAAATAESEAEAEMATPSGTKGAIRSGKGRVVEPRLGPCAPAVARPSKAGAGSRSDVISEAARAVGVRMRARTPLSRQAERRWHSLRPVRILGQVAAGKGGREQIEKFIHTEEAKDALCERLAQRPDTKAPPPPCALLRSAPA